MKIETKKFLNNMMNKFSKIKIMNSVKLIKCEEIIMKLIKFINIKQMKKKLIIKIRNFRVFKVNQLIQKVINLCHR